VIVKQILENKRISGIKSEVLRELISAGDEMREELTANGGSRGECKWLKALSAAIVSITEINGVPSEKETSATPEENVRADHIRPGDDGDHGIQRDAAHVVGVRRRPDGDDKKGPGNKNASALRLADPDLTTAKSIQTMFLAKPSMESGVHVYIGLWPFRVVLDEVRKVDKSSRASYITVEQNDGEGAARTTILTGPDVTFRCF
jgi:hypothetical protein